MTERDDDGTFVADEADTTDSDDILHSTWRDRDKYTCAICERYHTLNDPAEVEEHIEEHHQ